MHFPYSVSPPTWTSNGLYSMSTRPFLAVHRHNYGRIPRLFPVHTYAEQLHPPCHLFDKREFDGGWQHRRKFTKARAVLAPDAPQALMMTSPGVSDAEKTSTTVARSGPFADFFENDFLQINDNACSAMKETRNLQRHAWRSVNANTAAPPSVAPDCVLDSLLSESIQYQSEYQALMGTWSYPEPNSLSWPGTGNPLSIVRIGTERAVVCALTGSLESVAVYDLKTSTDPEDSHVQRLARRGVVAPVANALAHEMSPVTDIVASDWDDGSMEPCRALIATKKTLSFVNIATHAREPTCEWADHFPFPTTLSCSLNPLYPAEFAALSREGLFFGTAEEFLARCNGAEGWHEGFCDVQVIEPACWYNRVYYGAHPRTLLVSSRREITRFDTRTKVDLPSRDILFNVKEDWNLPEYDRFVSFFQPLCSRSHMAIVGTQTCMNYCDLRMPKHPILDWSISLPLPIEQVCVASLDLQQPRSEVIALASRRQCYLEVLHAVHGFNQADTGFESLIPQKSESAGRRPWKAPSVACASVLWSDLPLAHLQQLKGSAPISGMGLLPLNHDKQFSLLQWSPEDGLIGQLITVEPREDGESVFERQIPVNGRLMDSSTNMANFQRRLLACGEYKNAPSMRHPVSKCIGASLLLDSKKLYRGDAVRLRERVFKDGDDDVDVKGRTRFPRVFLKDLPRVVELRKKTETEQHEGGTDGNDSADPASKKESTVGNEDNGKGVMDAPLSGRAESRLSQRSDDESGDRIERNEEKGAGDCAANGKHQWNGNGRTKGQPVRKRLRTICGSQDRRAQSVTAKAVRMSTRSRSPVAASGKSDSSSSTDSKNDSLSGERKDRKIVTSNRGTTGQITLPPPRAQCAGSQGARLMETQASANRFPESSSSSGGSSGSSASGSSSGSSSSSPREGGEDESDLLQAIGHGKTLGEIGRIVRAGMAHSATPLGPGELRRAVEESEGVGWYDVEWHAGCSADHSRMKTAVTTDGDIPDWVCTRVYSTDEVNEAERLESSTVDPVSRYGRLLRRMKHHFFGDEGGAQKK